MATRPTIQQVRDFLRIPVTTLSDVDLSYVYSACVDDQDQRCTIPEDPNAFPNALVMGFLRRTQREVAARNLPLGVLGVDSEYGPQRISQYDAIIDTHERPYWKQVLA